MAIDTLSGRRASAREARLTDTAPDVAAAQYLNFDLLVRLTDDTYSCLREDVPVISCQALSTASRPCVRGADRRHEVTAPGVRAIGPWLAGAPRAGRSTTTLASPMTVTGPSDHESANSSRGFRCTFAFRDKAAYWVRAAKITASRAEKLVSYWSLAGLATHLSRSAPIPPGASP